MNRTSGSTPPSEAVDAGPDVSQAGERRSARIESLRALAALAVMAEHMYVYTAGFRIPEVGAARGSVTTIDELMVGGRLGVYLFFALTGYLLFWPFVKRYFDDGQRIDVGRYAINRALRILPLYYAVLVVVLLLQVDGEQPGVWLRFAAFGENFSAATAGTVVAPMWSLVVELHFYLLLPLGAWCLARLAGGSMRTAVWILLGLALVSIVVRYRQVLLPDEPADVWKYSLPTTFLFFVPGMCLALLRLRWERDRPAWLTGLWASADLWLLAAIPLWALAALVGELDPVVAIASLLVLGSCVLPLRTGPVVRALSWKPLALVGVASYSLYLWHTPVLKELVTGVDLLHSFGWLLILGTPLLILISLVSYRCIEAPFLRLRRQWARSSAPQSEPGAVATPTEAR